MQRSKYFIIGVFGLLVTTFASSSGHAFAQIADVPSLTPINGNNSNNSLGNVAKNGINLLSDFSKCNISTKGTSRVTLTDEMANQIKRCEEIRQTLIKSPYSCDRTIGQKGFDAQISTGGSSQVQNFSTNNNLILECINKVKAIKDTDDNKKSMEANDAKNIKRNMETDANSACKDFKGDEKAACVDGYIGKKTNESKDEACGAYLASKKEACVSGYTGDTKEGDDTAGCDVKLQNGLSWILCPVMELGANMSDAVFQHLVTPLLKGNPVGLDQKNSFYLTWQSFRNIANILLIAVMLIIVISQLTEGWGLNVVDAYTVKKVAPRLLIGIIGINISIYLCVAAVDIINVIGNGISYLMTKPFIDSGALNPQTGGSAEANIVGVLGTGLGAGLITGLIGAASTATAAGAGAAAISLSALEGLIFLMVPLLIVLVFATLGVLFTLIVRFGMIIFLTVISPVAIACFILPGTEKYFKMWYGQFIKTLVVYPIIAVIFAMCNIMSTLFVQLSSNDQINDSIGVVGLIVGTITVFMPTFLIPFSYKFAGGAIGAIGNLSQKTSSHWAEKGKKRFEAAKEKNGFVGQRYKANKSFRDEHGLTREQFSAGTAKAVLGKKGQKEVTYTDKDGNQQTAVLDAGQNRRARYREAARAIQAKNILHEVQNLKKENPDFQVTSLNDDALAALHSAGLIKKHGGSGREQREAMLQSFLGAGYGPDASTQWAESTMKTLNGMSGGLAEFAAVTHLPATGTGNKIKYDENGKAIDGGFGRSLVDLANAAEGNAVLEGHGLATIIQGYGSSGREKLSYAKANGILMRTKQRMATTGPAALSPAEIISKGVQEAQFEAQKGMSAQEVIMGKGETIDFVAKGINDRIENLINKGVRTEISETGEGLVEISATDSERETELANLMGRMAGLRDVQGTSSMRAQESLQKHAISKDFNIFDLPENIKTAAIQKRVENEFRKQYKSQVDSGRDEKQIDNAERAKMLDFARQTVLSKPDELRMSSAEINDMMKTHSVFQQVHKEFMEAGDAAHAQQINAQQQAQQQAQQPPKA